jgi:hypothetical protein
LTREELPFLVVPSIPSDEGSHDISRDPTPEKSVNRSRVEHVFADRKSQTGAFARTVSIVRATMRIRLTNIVYNMRRFLLLERINATL